MSIKNITLKIEESRVEKLRRQVRIKRPIIFLLKTNFRGIKTK